MAASKITLRGFLSANEMLERVRDLRPGITRVDVWATVAAGLLPGPTFDLPLKSVLAGAFLRSSVERLRLIVSQVQMPIDHLAKLQPEVQEDFVGDASKELMLDDSSDMLFSADEPEVEETLDAFVTLAVEAPKGIDKLFSTYARQAFLPRNLQTRVALALCLGRERFGWGDDAGELEVVERAVRLILEKRPAASLTLRELFDLLTNAQVAADEMFTRYLDWREKTGARAIDEASLRRHLIQEHADATLEKGAFTRSGRLWKTARRMPWTVLALGLFAVVALLSPIPEFVATALDGSPGLWALVFPPATVVYAAYRDVRRRSVFSPVLAEFVDAALFMVIYFASVYSLLAPAGAFAPNTFAPNKGLGPFDLFYFSVVTFSTTGFGDITPASTTARVLVTGQILIGSFFVIAVLGLLVSRLSAKTLRGRSGRR